MKELNDLNEHLNEKLEYYKQFSLNNFIKLFHDNSNDEFENLVSESCYVYQLVFGQEGYIFGDKEETLFYQRSDCQMMFSFLEEAFELLNRNDLSRKVKTNAKEFIEAETTYWKEQYPPIELEVL